MSIDLNEFSVSDTPVHPVEAKLAQGGTVRFLGINLREHFAGLAMPAVIADRPSYSKAEVASTSVGYADALIAELSKGEK